MLQWAWPWAPLLVIVGGLAWRFLPPATPAGRALWVPFFDEAGLERPSRPRPGRRRLLLASVGILLLVAAARPVWQDDAATEIPMTGRDLVVAFDISVSMLIRDMEMDGERVTRLSVSKDYFDEFIQRRTGDRVSLLVFGGRAFPLIPLTHDHDGLRDMLAQTDVGLAGARTAISATVALAAERMEQGREGAGEQVLLLFTDGANTAPGIPMDVAVARAAEQGIRIHTIGISARAGAEEDDFMADPMRDLDERLLRSVADATGGRYFPANDPESLRELLRTIDAIEPVAGHARLTQRRELYPWPLGAALLLVLVAMLSTRRTGGGHHA